MAEMYETVVIVDAMIPDEAITSEFEAIEKRINLKGELLKIDKWGRRKLSYQIKGRAYGEYAVFNYKADSSFPAELERGFRINENILRWLTVADNPAGLPEEKLEEPHKETETLDKNKKKEREEQSDLLKAEHMEEMKKRGE